MSIKQKVARWIYLNLSGDPREECTPPGDWLKHEFGEMDGDKPMHVAYTQNDGFELWLACNQGGKWLAHYRASEARQLAWFILWHWWGKATWFGLKRKLWYWGLRTMHAPWREQVRRRDEGNL